LCHKLVIRQGQVYKGRNTGNSEILGAASLESYGIRWRSFTEPWIESAGPFRDVVISLLASLAKQERIRLKERVKAELDRYRHDYNAGRVGKEVSSKSGKNLPVGRPKRIFARQRVFELRTQGHSYRQIARQLGIGEGTVRRVLKQQVDIV
jgi:putative DNA-invertase from lambdoid prophage Rac